MAKVLSYFQSVMADLGINQAKAAEMEEVLDTFSDQHWGADDLAAAIDRKICSIVRKPLKPVDLTPDVEGQMYMPLPDRARWQ